MKRTTALTLLARRDIPYNLFATTGYENHALFLAESRQFPELDQAWNILNQLLLENNIRQWVIREIVWRILEKALSSRFFQSARNGRTHLNYVRRTKKSNGLYMHGNETPYVQYATPAVLQEILNANQQFLIP